MANISGDKVSLRRPATPLRKPFLVAYSDSDSESSSSSTPGPAIDFKAEAKQLDAAEALMALCMTKITSPDESTARGTQKLLGTTIINNDNTIAEGSHHHDQADCHDTNLDDDEAISEVNGDTHEIEYEPTVSDCNDEAEDSTTMPRCWGDIKYPRIGTCDHEFNVVNEGERYRKVVSDFFGRNKKATASVPPDCYPTICRTCYQRLVYRLGSMNKDDPEKDAAAVAKLRCDAIIAALEKMKEKKFVDRNGHVWPWWCGLELQLTNDGRALLDNPEELEAEIEKKNGEITKQKTEKVTSPKGKLFKRLHKRVKPGPLPDWLQKLCRTNTGNSVSNDVATSTVGDRNGVRYSFDELILIIKAIKTFCHESRCAFPTVEAIPVPIGLLDEQILKDKKRLRTSANKMKNQTRKAAADAEREARDQPSNSMRKKKAAARRKAADDATAEAEAAEAAVDYAQEDALLSAGNVLQQRPMYFLSKTKECCLQVLSQARGSGLIQLLAKSAKLARFGSISRR